MTSESEYSEHYTAGPQCVLCREPFPREPVGTDGDRWQEEFRAVLLLKPTGLEERAAMILTPKARFIGIRDIVEIEIPSNATANVPYGERAIDICRLGVDGCYDCKVMQQQVYAFHVCCGNAVLAARYGCKPDSSIHDIFRLGRSTVKSYSVDSDPVAEEKARLTALIEDDSHLALLQRLPAELRIATLAELEPCIARSLLIVKGETRRLLRCIQTGTQASHSSEVVDLSSAMLLSASTVKFSGMNYLCALRQWPKNPAARLEHEVYFPVGVACDETITGIKFAMDRCGIRAIQVLGEYGNNSQWIGDQRVNGIYGRSNSWFGVMRGSQVTGIRLRYDDLKCVYMDIISPETWSSSFGNHFIWDYDVPPSFNSTLQPEMFIDFKGKNSCGSIRNFLDWRLMTYLSLCEAGSYIYGLTIFYYQGIVGMEAHFGHTTRLSGRRQGCPIHFRLRIGEYLTHVWAGRLRAPEGFNFGQEPMVVVQTNFHRSYKFGPCLDDMKKYEWKSLSAKKDGHVSGIYYDAIKFLATQIMTMGLTWHCGSIKFSPPKTLTFPRLWNYPAIGGPNTGIFVSIASLRDISQIETCKVGARITGMLIHHKDDSVDVLGQWFVAQGSSEIESIYNHEQGDIHTICFGVSELAERSFVTGIWVTTKKSKAPKGLRYTQSFGQPNFKKPLAWWFSQHFDHVVSWEGRSQRMPMS